MSQRWWFTSCVLRRAMSKAQMAPASGWGVDTSWGASRAASLQPRAAAIERDEADNGGQFVVRACVGQHVLVEGGHAERGVGADGPEALGATAQDVDGVPDVPAGRPQPGLDLDGRVDPRQDLSEERDGPDALTDQVFVVGLVPVEATFRAQTGVVLPSTVNLDAVGIRRHAPLTAAARCRCPCATTRRSRSGRR